MSRQLGDLGAWDVVVVGSGSAGSTAAVSAARNGARTLLIEKLPFLGGVSTAVLDTFYGFYTPGSRAAKVVGGVADEVVAGLGRLGPVVERPNTYGAGTGVTYLAEHLKVVWEQLVTGAGAMVLVHAFVQDAEVEGGRVRRLVVATKAGLAQLRAGVVVDASGDADVCHFAGLGYELAGATEPAQTLTTTFRLVNVDTERRRAVAKQELHRLMAEAADSGAYDLPRRDGSDHITPVEGMTATVMTRLPSARRDGDRVVNATDPVLLTEAERARLAALSTQVGVRETRRVFGDARLTADDVLSARQFDDQVGLCGAPLEDHHDGDGTRWRYLPDGQVVGIPFATLVARDAANVLVAGRCFSATHDAHASVRSMAQCMAMGQAAGTAAAMAATAGVEPRELAFGRLAAALRAAGAILEPGLATAAP